MSRHNHPGWNAHSTRVQPEPINATILMCPVIGQSHPVTLHCLQQYAYGNYVLEWLNPDNAAEMKYGMRNAISRYWTGERDLIHIDHDMLFTWDNLRDFANCDSAYCTCPYWSFGELITAPLGFTKFSAELQRMMPIDEVFVSADMCEDRKVFGEFIQGCYGDWWGFEHHMARALRRFVPEPCVHNQVLNDHSMYGLKKKHQDHPALRADLATDAGREELRAFLKAEGWSGYPHSSATDTAPPS
jgi:hypothetical protein